ncbi:protease adaptor protein RcdA [Microbaculum sp. FT89]|uniref:protease adaptor protein RcdA n=1 Tax=Microbaculum sp. FT89 TaxID=3447298 RepID=UPI003F531CDC
MRNDKTDVREASDPRLDPVNFAERMAGSGNFMTLFREGMALLEETADYLDGPGRTESRTLSRLGGLAYATESMKLTTRLMQMASWLLLQRAVNEGEMSDKQASEEKGKVRLEHPEDRERSAGFDELPEGLQDLIARSLRLQARVRHLDRQLRGQLRADDARAANPVFSQLDRVRSAFGGSEG